MYFRNRVFIAASVSRAARADCGWASVATCRRSRNSQRFWKARPGAKGKTHDSKTQWIHDKFQAGAESGLPGFQADPSRSDPSSVQATSTQLFSLPPMIPGEKSRRWQATRPHRKMLHRCGSHSDASAALHTSTASNASIEGFPLWAGSQLSTPSRAATVVSATSLSSGLLSRVHRLRFQARRSSIQHPPFCPLKE